MTKRLAVPPAERSERDLRRVPRGVGRLRRIGDLQTDGRALRDPKDVAGIVAVAVLRPRVDRARRSALLHEGRLAEIVAETLRISRQRRVLGPPRQDRQQTDDVL